MDLNRGTYCYYSIGISTNRLFPYRQVKARGKKNIPSYFLWNLEITYRERKTNDLGHYCTYPNWQRLPFLEDFVLSGCSEPFLKVFSKAQFLESSSGGADSGVPFTIIVFAIRSLFRASLVSFILSKLQIVRNNKRQTANGKQQTTVLTSNISHHPIHPISLSPPTPRKSRPLLHFGFIHNYR